MSKPTSMNRREIHCRSIECKGYQRDDELWDIEGRVVDTKSEDYRTLEHLVAVGDAMHDMFVRLTVDNEFNIREIEVRTNSSPFKDCPGCNAAYERIIGLNTMMPGFQKKVKELMQGSNGCTHITELFGPLATTAYQTIGSWLNQNQYDGKLREKDWKLLVDSCYGFRSTGKVVATNFPELHRLPASPTTA